MQLQLSFSNMIVICEHLNFFQTKQSADINDFLDDSQLTSIIQRRFILCPFLIIKRDALTCSSWPPSSVDWRYHSNKQLLYNTYILIATAFFSKIKIRCVHLGKNLGKKKINKLSQYWTRMRAVEPYMTYDFAL